MEMPEKLAKKRDELAEPEEQYKGYPDLDECFKMGFNACYKELEPLIEFLRMKAKRSSYTWIGGHLISSAGDFVHEGELNCAISALMKAGIE